MKAAFFALLFTLPALCCSSIAVSGREKTQKPGVQPKSPVNDTITGKRLYWGKRMDGYVVYRRDTIRGLIILHKKDVLVEQPIDGDYSYFHVFKLKDTAVKSIVMYNFDKKPVCLTRLNEKNNRLLRVVHEGRLNIYDGKIDFIYAPGDIDKYLLVVSYGNTVDDLSSFLAETTKSDLIMYINDLYGMKLVPKELSWKQLMVIIDQLD